MCGCFLGVLCRLLGWLVDGWCVWLIFFCVVWLFCVLVGMWWILGWWMNWVVVVLSWFGWLLLLCVLFVLFVLWWCYGCFRWWGSRFCWVCCVVWLVVWWCFLVCLCCLVLLGLCVGFCVLVSNDWWRCFGLWSCWWLMFVGSDGFCLLVFLYVLLGVIVRLLGRVWWGFWGYWYWFWWSGFFVCWRFWWDCCFFLWMWVFVGGVDVIVWCCFLFKLCYV